MPNFTTSSTTTTLIKSMEVNASNLGKASANGSAEDLNFFKTLEMGKNVISTGIKLNRILNVAKQGTPEHVDNDLAMMIGDGGFFAVTDTSDADDTSLKYTRSGYFQFDKDGNLKNSEGLYLRIAKLNGATDTTNFIQNNIDAGDLVALNKNDLTSSLKETSEISLNFTLPLPKIGDTTVKSEFTKQFSAFDKVGQAHTINLSFQRDPENNKKWKVYLRSNENIEIKDNKNNMVFVQDKEKLDDPLMDTAAPFEIEFDNEGKLLKVSKLNQVPVEKTINKTDAKGEVYYLAENGSYYTSITLPQNIQFKQATDDAGNLLWEGADGNGYLNEADAKASGTTLKYATNEDNIIQTEQVLNQDGKGLWKADDGNTYSEDALPVGINFSTLKDEGGNILYHTTDGEIMTLADAKDQGKTIANATKNVNGADETLFVSKDDPTKYYTKNEAIAENIELAQASTDDGQLLWQADNGTSYIDEDAANADGAHLIQLQDDNNDPLFVAMDGTYITAADAIANGIELAQATKGGEKLWMATDGNSYTEAEVTANPTITLEQATRGGEKLWMATDGNHYTETEAAADPAIVFEKAMKNGAELFEATDGKSYTTAEAAADPTITFKTQTVQKQDQDGNLLWEADDGNTYKDDTDAAAAGTTLKKDGLGANVPATEQVNVNAKVQANVISPQKAFEKSYAMAMATAKIPLMQNVKIPHKIASTETVNTFDWEASTIIDASNKDKIVNGKTALTFTWSDGGVTTSDFFFGEPLKSNTTEGLSTKYSSFSGEISQNGNAIGQFQSLSISNTGVITVIYDNGLTSDYAKIPVVQFNAPNALTAISDNAYIQTHDSGPFRLMDGKIITGVVEKSSVDQIRNIIEANNTQKTVGFVMKAYAKQNEVEDMILKTL